MKIKIAAEIRQHSRRWSNGWAIFRCCCFSTVLWTTVMNENNNQRYHFLKYLFENPNVSVLQWNALYNFSVMCPILIDTPFLAPKKTVIDSSRANFSLDLLTFFFFKVATEYFLQLPLFICTFRRCILLTGWEICWICLNFTAQAQFLGVHLRANDRWLTDQYERALYFCYVIKEN